jgi:hypothetical protein
MERAALVAVAVAVGFSGWCLTLGRWVWVAGLPQA